MNIHIVVEGVVGEAKVYRHWVPLVNPSLSYVPHISEIANDNFSIVAGGGYPQYYDVIDACIADVHASGKIADLHLYSYLLKPVPPNRLASAGRSPTPAGAVWPESLWTSSPD